jgi:hypothetical protein
MEVLFSLPILIIPFILPMIAGLMAKTYGRSFWTWFLIGLPLPLIANVILLCLPDRTKKYSGPVSKDKSGRGSLVWINPANEEDQLDFSKIA